MEACINAAVKLYSGDKPLGLFVQRLIENIKEMNRLFEAISYLFKSEGISNFERLPDDIDARKKFAKDFNELNSFLAAAKIQGFKWSKKTYKEDATGECVDVAFDEKTYLILVLRYKELFSEEPEPVDDPVPYDIAGYITEIDTGRIDADYMNSRFDKYLKLLHGDEANTEAVEAAEAELHKTFATLGKEEQKYANIFLHDIQRGDIELMHGKTLRDYINDYAIRAKDDQVHRISVYLGVDEDKLKHIMSLGLNESNLNEFGRYEELRQTIDTKKAKDYFEALEGEPIKPRKIPIKADQLLHRFIVTGGFDIEIPEDALADTGTSTNAPQETE